MQPIATAVAISGSVAASTAALLAQVQVDDSVVTPVAGVGALLLIAWRIYRENRAERTREAATEEWQEIARERRDEISRLETELARYRADYGPLD